jgi:hypothetical protein
VFVRACDVDAGEVVKMSHMASATHASPSRSSGREEDGTEATDEAGGEACGVGVVVRWVVQHHNGLHSQRGGVMDSFYRIDSVPTWSGLVLTRCVRWVV